MDDWLEYQQSVHSLRTSLAGRAAAVAARLDLLSAPGTAWTPVAGTNGKGSPSNTAARMTARRGFCAGDHRALLRWHGESPRRR